MTKYWETECNKDVNTTSVQTNTGICESYDTLKIEHKKLNKMLDDAQDKLEKVTSDRAKINGDNKILNQQLQQLRDHEVDLRNLIEDRDETIKKFKAKPSFSETDPMNATCCDDTIPSLSNDIQKLINERFDKIEENIDHLITQKLSQNSKNVLVEQIEAKLNE